MKPKLVWKGPRNSCKQRKKTKQAKASKPGGTAKDEIEITEEGVIISYIGAKKIEGCKKDWTLGRNTLMENARFVSRGRK